jgi:Na+/phosphate symporter
MGAQSPHRARGVPSVTLATMALGDAARGVVRHPMRAYYVPIAAAALLGSSAFMPWIVVGDRRVGGVPDFAGLWVLALAVLAVILACLSIATRKNSRHPLLLVGLFAFGVLLLGEQLLARTASQQGWANAQARAIVEGVEAPPAVAPLMAPGAYMGLAASTIIALFGLTVVFKRAPQIYAEAEDDDA